MKRVLMLVVVAIVAIGCDKPTEDNCRKAISNMRSLLGTEALPSHTDITGEIRRCKGGSSRKSVECAMNATSIEQLEACDFMKVPGKEERCRRALEHIRTLTGAGSAAPTADDVHRCRVSTTRKEVECAIKASSADELKECKFMAPPAAGSNKT